jgi:serine/threonine protein kinase
MQPSVPGVERLEEVGRGGSGIVYRGWQLGFGRWVAVKVFSPDEDFRRLERERLAVGRLSDHPSITPVFDGGVTEDGRAYLIMAYMEGGSLRDRVHEHAAMSAQDTVSFGRAMASALQVAHDHGIWHRDIKPGNILYDRFGTPRLADFGIAHIGEDGFRTATGLVSGTAAYLAPEILEGHAFTAAADVFSLGATIYYALTGHAMFTPREGEAPASFLLRRLAPAELPVFPPHTPGPLRSIILEATHPRVEHRLASADALDRRLTELDPTPGPPTAPAVTTPATAAPTTGTTPSMMAPTVGPVPAVTPDPTETTPSMMAPTVGLVPEPVGTPVGDPPRSRMTPRVLLVSLVVVLLVIGGTFLVRGLVNDLRAAGWSDPTTTGSATTPSSSSSDDPGSTTTPTPSDGTDSPGTLQGAEAVQHMVEEYRKAVQVADPEAVRLLFYPYTDDRSPYGRAILVNPEDTRFVDEYRYDAGVSTPEPTTMSQEDLTSKRWSFSEVAWSSMDSMFSRTESICRASMSEAGIPDQADADGDTAGITHLFVERDLAFHDGKVVVQVYFSGGARWSGGYVVFSASGSLLTDRYCQVS